MNAKAIWILVGLAALFASGFATGILCSRHVLPVKANHRAHEHRNAGALVDHFRERLNLTDEQTAEVKAVLENLHQQMTALAGDFHEQFEAHRSRAWTDIRAALTEQQQRLEFENIVEELEAEHGAHMDASRASGKKAGPGASNEHSSHGDSQ